MTKSREISLVKESDTICARMCTQLLESLGLDLTDTLTRDSELFSDFFERMHFSAIETKSHDDDLLLTRREKVEHLVEIFFEDREIGCFFRSEIFIIFDEVTKRRIFLTTDRGVEREDILRYSHNLADLANVHFQFERELFHKWFTSKFLGQAAVGMVELINRLDHMYWYTDSTSLISDSTSDSLTDPPCRIRRELKSSIRVEFIDGTEETNVSLLHQIEKSESTSHVFFRDGHDETEIGFCKSLTSFLISLLDETTETNFLFSIDKGKSPDLVQVHTDRVIRNL